MKKWTIDDARELYNINGWGTSYFGINDEGHVYVTPCKDQVQIDLREVMDELQLRDVTPPVLLRFPDILDSRIEKTWSCFKKASEEYDYRGENYVVYPIKVNQMQPVVEEIISHGRKFNLGLEAGSKPELHAVIAMQCQSDSIIVCNGYKDQSYIELALLAQKMGKQIFIVVEKLNELEIIAREAKKLNVRPNIGIRIKLASSGAGKWEESGGDASKFGLTSSELLEALDLLDKKDMRDCLRLIHFHIGSQITKIRRIQTALREASQFYIQLHKMGTAAADWASTTTARARPAARARSTTASRNTSTTVSTPSSRPLTRTTCPTPTSSLRADARWLPTTRCSSSTCSRRPHCPRCRRSSSPTRTRTSWSRTSMRFGTTCRRATCSKTGTTPNRYARRCSTSFHTASSTSRRAPTSRPCTGASVTKSMH